MQKIKLTKIQADKVSQILIEENRLKQEYQKVTNRKTDLVELILDAQGLTVEELAGIKSYNFSGGEGGDMFIELIKEKTLNVPMAKSENEEKKEVKQSPPKKKK